MKDENPIAPTPRLIRVESGSELDRLLEETGGTTVELEQRGVRYRLTRVSEPVRGPSDVADEQNIWSGYDPERLRRALRTSAGALHGIDFDQLKRDLAEQRSQDSMGRPA